MVALNPDKEIRKAVFDRINGIEVSGRTIKCFDSRATNAPSEYVLMTVQTKEISRTNKCERRWETSLLIEIYTRQTSSGNTGSRVLLNDIEQEVYSLIYPTLSVAGFQTLDQDITFEAQIDTPTDTEIVSRSFLRLNLTLI